jgi:hypothetical protein
MQSQIVNTPFPWSRIRRLFPHRHVPSLTAMGLEGNPRRLRILYGSQFVFVFLGKSQSPLVSNFSALCSAVVAQAEATYVGGQRMAMFSHFSNQVQAVLTGPWIPFSLFAVNSLLDEWLTGRGHLGRYR